MVDAAEEFVDHQLPGPGVLGGPALERVFDLLAMQQGPLLVPGPARELAGAVQTLALLCGLTAGATFSLLLAHAIRASGA